MCAYVWKLFVDGFEPDLVSLSPHRELYLDNNLLETLPANVFAGLTLVT